MEKYFGEIKFGHFFIKKTILNFRKFNFLCCYIKIQFAEIYGAKGVLLFDDRSAAPIVSDYIYPKGEFLPRDGVQRGTVMLLDGDPHTFNYPSNGYHFLNLFKTKICYQ